MNRNSVTANLSIFKIGISSSDFKISKIGSDRDSWTLVSLGLK